MKISLCALLVSLPWLPVSLKADVLFSEDFQSAGAMDRWPADCAIPVVTDPAAASNKVAAAKVSEEGATSWLFMTNPQEIVGSDGQNLRLKIRINGDNAPEAWNSSFALMGKAGANGGQTFSGYGVTLEYHSAGHDDPGQKVGITLFRLDDNNARVPIATSESSIEKGSGWNDVAMEWKVDGQISVSLNGQIVAQAKDTTYPVAFHEFWSATFTPPTKDSVPENSVLFDDIKVETFAP